MDLRAKKLPAALRAGHVQRCGASSAAELEIHGQEVSSMVAMVAMVYGPILVWISTHFWCEV